MKIYYHGTSKENSESILEEGFRKGSWFAMHLEDAFFYGGPYIFEVEMDIDKEELTYDWQFWVSIPISPERIRRHYHLILEES